MEKGLLTCFGTIDINQFWPQNIKTKNRYDSDADTVKVKINKDKGFDFISSNKVKTNGNILFTAGFWQNIKDKKGNKTAKFKPVINKDNIVTIRVQGVDAPELHYCTGKPLYRQNMGETSTVELYNFLKTFADGNIVNCKITTRVDKPNEVFDKYGRLVGDIIIVDKNGNDKKDKSGKVVNVNYWLVEKGYAFPAFYDSLEIDEINAFIDRYKVGKNENIWKFYSNKVNKIDRNLTHDKKNSSYSKDDKKSPVIFPKLFRRLWSYEIGQDKIQFSEKGYFDFIKSGKNDKFIETKKFLEDKKAKKKSDFYQLADALENFVFLKFKPYEIVIKEDGTTLKDGKGKQITGWN